MAPSHAAGQELLVGRCIDVGRVARVDRVVHVAQQQRQELVVGDRLELGDVVLTRQMEQLLVALARVLLRQLVGPVVVVQRPQVMVRQQTELVIDARITSNHHLDV